MAGDKPEKAGGSGKNDAIDANSPYYIHPSDLPKQMHVNETLTDGNYSDWAKEMANFLFAKNKMGFVDGTIPKPEKTAENYMQWMRCDAMIIGWLTTAMDKDIRGSVKYANTSSEIWDDLKERFGKESAPRAYELKQSLSVTHQDGSSVSAYYTKLRGIWDEIQSVLPVPQCTCGNCSCNIGKRLSEFKERERLYEFLMGLDGDFSIIRTHVLSIKPTPTLGEAYRLASEEEQQRQITMAKRAQVEPAAFKTQGWREGSFNSQRNNKGPSKDPKRNTGEEIDHCNHCGKDGHKREGCFKLIGYPEWWPGKTKVEKVKPKAAHIESELGLAGLTDAQYQALIKHFNINEQKTEGDQVRKANMAGKHNKTDDWVVDSGSTEHIVHKFESLENGARTTREAPVMIPNGDNIPVVAKGDCTLSGGNKINEVLYIPDFNCNLLSVSRLSKELQCVVSFFPDFVVMQGLQSKKLIGTGECISGLYRMGMATHERKAMATKVDARVWHSRLGHASDSKLSNIDFFKNVSFNFKDDVCDSCVKAKHTRTPFPKSFIKTNECFDLIHCDIWGKYRKPSTTHASFFLTIVDDFSRAIWVFLIKHKSEASDCLISFHNMVKTQFSKQIKRVRSDNGGEFTSNRMKEFYAREGILLETTCPHTPQQNGVVERKHRHLLETARALMFHANIPKRFWGECIETATYIINRLPSKVLKNQTPYEIVFGHKPDYEHMRTLGCLAYYSSIETGGDKFEFRGRPGVFMGYPQGTKGFKILDIEHGRMAISRDVKFAETNFPFAQLKPKNITPDFFETSNWQEDDWVKQVEAENNEGNATVHSDSQAESTEPTPPLIPVESNDETQAATETETQHLHDEHQAPRATRTRIPSSRLKDFEVTLPPSIDHAKPVPDRTSSTVHPLSNYVSYNKFSASHQVFLAAITSVNEPKSFKEAMQDENWRLAMQREIKALEENETWTLETLPEGKHAIDSKWVYKIKYKPNGEIERYKARLVARGFTQIEGVDYHDTFAPVAKLVTIRTLITIAVKRNWLLHQLDVNNAFLHGDLKEEVYMKVPQGFSNEGNATVCRLRKSLYGLKQASRTWYQKFTVSLLEIGFKQSHADHSLFTYKEKDKFVAILIYVDDVVITGNHEDMIKRTKDHLNVNFSIKDLGPLKYFLGIEVARTEDGMVLSQHKYSMDILSDCGQLGCRPSAFPMEQNLKLGQCHENHKADASLYRRLIGRLLYLQATRPDITYAVNVLSQFVSDPRTDHMNAVLRVLRYLKSTLGQGIFIPKTGGLNLVAYCDADWLGCPYTRRSRTGYLLLLGGAPVSWKTKKQSVVSRSSAEAEYRAMATTVSEVLWMRWLLKDLTVNLEDATPLYCDNQAARHIANNPVFHERTKHVEMDCFFVRERVESHEILPLHVTSKQQIADLLTKPLGAQPLRDLLGKLGVRNLHTPA
ncbi:hypothetical protein L1887_22411 [Cichorium endivia]|nr:hypothetical protein L1887_22411 [Cichorium endivia]